MNISNERLLSEHDVQNEINARTNQLMSELEHREKCKIDRGFFWLMFMQWCLGTLVAVVVSPYTWIGETKIVHLHVWFAFAFGSCLSAYPMWLIWKRPGEPKTRMVVSIAQAVWTCLLIHLTGGRIETHFHAFASLAFLAAYKDVRVLVIATAVIAIDHLVRGMVWPASVYGVAISSGFRFLEHAGWLLFMVVFLIWSCLRRNKEALEKYHRRAVLEEQAKLNEQMIHVSREAGKAEIATGVLHNVGNVMNSVNVSADILRDQMQSKVYTRLKAAHSLLQEHQPDLPSFFANDKRAENFIPFIGQLNDDVDELLDEINNLQEKLSHVNSVVASQQDLATMSGLTSTFHPRDAVNSAVSMFRELLQRSNISIECEIGEETTISSDKQRLIQVLVNLIRNAKHAITDAGVSPGLINIKLFTLAENATPTEKNRIENIPVQEPDSNNDLNLDISRLVIQIADNGSGIAKDDLDKIFQHGFSTRKDRGGHGFGLHHTICVLQELGGCLTAESEGLGKGATFTIQLPTQPTPVNQPEFLPQVIS